VTDLGNGLGYLDLHFQGVPSVIATAVLDAPGGVALVDPGPPSCLPALRRGLEGMGIGIRDVRTLLLTHIHLDHAGASGTLLRENPDIVVYVHERGAKHMIDPSKLLESASRLYGDQMHRLWGHIEPVPAGAVRSIAGGERLEAGGRAIDVAYTPGHAWHHVSYFDATSGTAFVGDTAGVRIGTSTFIMPPTPPPDIELDTWRASAACILAWTPETLFLTHFGPSTSPAAHLHDMLDRLDRTAGFARRALQAGGTDAEQTAAFERDIRAELQRLMTPVAVRSYELAVPFNHCFMGLARYWRKREA
jgi:glyoxylase-like metal-dependent hydrolase (beta-lactamase superfamily II)